MALEITISTGNPRPIYRQVAEQIGKAIRLGHLAEGDALPSVRALAEQLLINPNTVARAYSELSKDGVIISKQGKGFFAGKRRMIFTAEERERRLAQAIESVVSESLMMDVSADDLLRRIEKHLKSHPPSHE
ncbi:MAG: GntR family transcriptional regulator [Chthoniobacterales bacterium]